MNGQPTFRCLFIAPFVIAWLVQDANAHITILFYIRMPDFGNELHARRSQRILFWEMQMSLEETALTTAAAEKNRKMQTFSQQIKIFETQRTTQLVVSNCVNTAIKKTTMMTEKIVCKKM